MADRRAGAAAGARAAVAGVAAIALATLSARAAVADPDAPAPPPDAPPRFDVPARAVVWRAPAECGDGTALRRRIAGYLDHAIGARPLGAVTVTRGDDGAYRADLRIAGPDGAVTERTVAARDCDALVDAVALVLGMAAQAPGADDATAPAAGDEVALAPPAPEPRRLSLRLRGGADAGAVPHGGFGVGAGAVLVAGRLAVAAQAEWFPSRFEAMPGTPSAGVDVGLAGGQVEGCVHATGGWLCVGWDLAAMSGTGVDVVSARTQRSLWSAVTAGVAGELRVGGARLVGEVEGYAATRRPRFVLDDGTALYEPSMIGARLWLGVELGIL